MFQGMMEKAQSQWCVAFLKCRQGGVVDAIRLDGAACKTAFKMHQSLLGLRFITLCRSLEGKQIWWVDRAKIGMEGSNPSVP